jgi:hydroxymethylpyrimidine/phosphomethylpyrimidine kinase
VLVVARSDFGGGAGIQADIKTVTVGRRECRLTAHNTVGIYGVLPIPADFVRQQMAAVCRSADAYVMPLEMR